MTIRRLGLVVLTVASFGLWLTPAGGQQQSAPGDSVPGEIIVKFRRTADAARRDALMSARGARILKHFDQMELTHVQVGRNVSVAALLAQLSGDQEVEFAQPNFVYRVGSAPALPPAAVPPDDPLWLDGSLWGLGKISAAQAWSAVGAGNGSVIIADIDSGVQYTHPDLAANIWRNPAEIPANGVDDDHNGYVDDVFGIDTTNHDSDPMDDHGHGTHTAGTICRGREQQPGCGGCELEREDPGPQVRERRRQRIGRQRNRVLELHRCAETARAEHPRHEQQLGVPTGVQSRRGIATGV